MDAYPSCLDDSHDRVRLGNLQRQKAEYRGIWRMYTDLCEPCGRHFAARLQEGRLVRIDARINEEKGAGRRGQTLDFRPSISALASLPLHLPAHVIPLRNKMGTDPAFPARSIQFGI